MLGDDSCASYFKLGCVFFLQLIIYPLPSKETTSFDSQDELIIARYSVGSKFHWHQQNETFR